MATETILMEAVKRGGDRQDLHERIRMYSMQASERVKMHGLDNNLLHLIKADPAFGLSEEEIDALLDPQKFTGCASVQTLSFIDQHVTPVLNEDADKLGIKDDVRV